MTQNTLLNCNGHDGMYSESIYIFVCDFRWMITKIKDTNVNDTSLKKECVQQIIPLFFHIYIFKGILS